MNLVSQRVITADVARLIDFYEKVTGLPAHRITADFAEIVTGSGTLAIAGAATVPPSIRAGERITEFLVDDVDAVPAAGEVLLAPTTMPWGNRSTLLRDPSGGLVNLFTPVTPAAIEKFARFRG
ncbi:glyoxalase [Actinoplanes sp. SE50]|uniref:VOC family protein n=1 Tax=unclassified Actinoplanes TaxID=2626549 RepID=UPI00023ECD03|nr:MULTISPECIES: VOC family protein [unclassified Actinoplanes]AEV85470.1 glyoxalase/bleomycin resistance protein/dioxygenase [Actinoplanes sp. SE50/110]ATO83863.1 glyoxalase [Actinoplanes sp. SE50]SLM01273.1 glyoxalase [Actinoplanes sp. SE50/110]